MLVGTRCSPLPPLSVGLYRAPGTFSDGVDLLPECLLSLLEEIHVGASSSNPAPPIPSNNPDEILLDDEEPDVEAPPPAPVPPALTQFLALDKCLPQRQFLEVVDVDVPSPNPNPLFSFDPEWLAINRAFHPWFSTVPHQRTFPDEQEARAMVSKELEWVNANIKKDENGVIPVEDWQSFAQTAPGPGSEGANKHRQRELDLCSYFLDATDASFQRQNTPIHKLSRSARCSIYRIRSIRRGFRRFE